MERPAPHLPAMATARVPAASRAATSDAPPNPLARFARALVTPGERGGWGEVLVFMLLAALVVVLAYHSVVFDGRTLTLGATWEGVLPSGPYGYPETHPFAQISDPLGLEVQEPWHLLGARLWASGQVPLWDPYLGGGRPLAASYQAGIYFLPDMLFSALPYPLWDIFYLLRLVLAGTFAYLFFRALKLSPLGAATGALAYLLSGALVWAVEATWINGLLLLPLALWCVERLVTSTKHRLAWSVGLAVLTWQILVAGFPEVILLVLTLVGLYYGFRAAQEAVRAARAVQTAGAWRVGAVRLGGALGRYALSALAGVALAAPQLFTFAEFVANSDGSRLNDLRLGDYFDLHYALRLFLPYFFGARFTQWNGATQAGFNSEFYSVYIGMAAALLALVAVLAALLALVWPKWRGAWWATTLFFAGVLLLTLARMHNLPAVSFVNAIPLYRSIHFQLYGAGIAALCVAALVAIGSDHLLARDVWTPWCTIPLLLGIVGLLLLPGLRELQASLGHLTAADRANAVASVWASMVAGGAFLALGALGLAVASFAPQVGRAALLAVMLVELVSYVPTTLPLRYNVYTPPPYLAFVQQDTQPFRTFGLDGVAYPPVQMGLGLDDMRDFDAEFVGSYHTLIQRGYDPHAFDLIGFPGIDGALPPGALTEAQAAERNAWVLRLFNVKYVLTNGTNLGNAAIVNISVHAPFDLSESGDLGPGVALGQSFVAPVDGLSAVLLSFASRGDASGSVTLHLRAAPGSTSDLRTVTLPASAVRTSGVTRFAFAPLAGSAGRGYYLVVEAQGTGPASHLRLWQVTATPNNPVQGADANGRALPDTALVLAVESGPEPGDASVSPYRLIYNQDVQVYENQGALPRAFVAHQVRTGVTDAGAIAALSQPGFPLSQTLLLAGTPPAAEVAQAAQAGRASTDGHATVTRSDANEVDLRATMTHAGFVALQDTYYPGWRATVDGVATPIYRSDVNFRAIYVPAGTHTIRFTYLPPSFVVGVGVMLLPPALLALGATAAHSIGGIRRRRRKHQAQAIRGTRPAWLAGQSGWRQSP